MTTLSFHKNIFCYVELCKPRIVLFCLMMAVGGTLLCPHKINMFKFIIMLIGTALTVSSANTFNMIYERHSDAFMRRTKSRPLVTGKLSLSNVYIFGFLLGVLGILVLLFFVNYLTALLSLFAIISYTLIYTPLKTRTPLALVIGAVPGAIPPLLGWTAADPHISFASLALFSVLFAWQMPHFIAISISQKKDYEAAGIKVVPLVRGEKIAMWQSVIWSVVLLVSSLSLLYFKLGGLIYGLFAITLGTWFLFQSILGIKKPSPAWPRKFFFASLIYLPCLIIGLAVDRLFYTFFIGTWF